LQGRYFFPLSARCVDAVAHVAGQTLDILGADGTALASIPLKSVKASSRLGAMRRRLDFPDGSSFDTADNDAVDQMTRGGVILHRLENSWRVILVSLIFASVAAIAFTFYGIPQAAAWLARHTPPSVARYTTQQTLATLDAVALSPSKLSAGQQRHYGDLLAQLAARTPRGAGGYRLAFRRAPGIGPNAFALPDGTIVVTDEIIAIAKSDEEIQGVFGHEMSHVDHAHGLQRVYQASLVPAAIAFITGDASQLGHFAAILPGILLQSAYSRSFEQEADDDGAQAMRRIGKSPAPLADLLERMERKMCGKDGCGQGWLGSHPDTAARAARLRRL
jgi:Zn-dependent protease with chaperone function